MSKRLFPSTSPFVSPSLSAFACEGVFWKVYQLLREVVCSEMDDLLLMLYIVQRVEQYHRNKCLEVF